MSKHSQSLFYYGHKLILVVVFTMMPLISMGQISLVNQSTYIQNFNTLASTGFNNTVLPSGWYFIEAGANKDAFYAASSGTNSMGNTYSLGSAGSSERSLGSIQSSSEVTTIGARFYNNSEDEITRLEIVYRGEQWRLGYINRSDRLDFQYSTDASDLRSGTWFDVDLLDFVAKSGTTPSVLDGNLAENSALISSFIDRLVLAPGSSIWIRWLDFNADMTDDALGIDDFSITPSNPCNVVINSVMPASGPVNTLVNISGDNVSEVTSVLFNGKEAAFTIVNNTIIRARVPEGATTGKVSCVGARCSTITSDDFTVTGSNCQVSSGLILSELCDPQLDYQTDRFIEIYNPTANLVNLEGWSVRARPNNADISVCEGFTICWQLSGVINPGQALTCGYEGALHVDHDFNHPEWYTNSTLIDTYVLWNGQFRDGAALYNGDMMVDGILGNNVENSWYDNRSLVRKSDACASNATSSYLDWTVSGNVMYANTSPATPGEHATSCNNSILPVINGHPLSFEGCEGELLSLEVMVSGGMVPLRFRWFELVTNGWAEVVDGPECWGANSSKFTISNLSVDHDGRQFYCVITNDDGDCYVTSNACQLSVMARPAVSLIWHE